MPRTSDKAQLIMDYVNQFIQENGYSPSVREIGAAVGLRSTASVSYHLQALQEKGLLQSPGAKGRKRALVTGARPGQIPIVGVVTAGVPILAVFHSCSAGQTRSSGQVWVSDLPYLQAVSSPEPADSIPNYYSRVEFTAEEFREKVLASYPEADLSGDISGWLQNAVTDTAGSVESVDVGGVSMKGSTLRSVLGLRSACFEWEAADGKLVFFVTGYGHGVGMSQYGANQMAKEGADYRTILTHYYTGVTVEPYTTAAIG